MDSEQRISLRDYLRKNFSIKKLFFVYTLLRGDTQMTSTGKNEVLSDVGGGGLASVLDVQSLFFLLKKIEFAPWPDIMHNNIIYYWHNNILLARNLLFDSDVRQWNHPFMIPLHCLCAKSKNRTRSHFEYNVTLVFFCFGLISFIHLHGTVVVP